MTWLAWKSTKWKFRERWTKKRPENYVFNVSMWVSRCGSMPTHCYLGVARVALPRHYGNSQWNCAKVTFSLVQRAGTVNTQTDRASEDNYYYRANTWIMAANCTRISKSHNFPLEKLKKKPRTMGKTTTAIVEIALGGWSVQVAGATHSQISRPQAHAAFNRWHRQNESGESDSICSSQVNYTDTDTDTDGVRVTIRCSRYLVYTGWWLSERTRIVWRTDEQLDARASLSRKNTVSTHFCVSALTMRKISIYSMFYNWTLYMVHGL